MPRSKYFSSKDPNGITYYRYTSSTKTEYRIPKDAILCDNNDGLKSLRIGSAYRIKFRFKFKFKYLSLYSASLTLIIMIDLKQEEPKTKLVRL